MAFTWTRGVNDPTQFRCANDKGRCIGFVYPVDGGWIACTMSRSRLIRSIGDFRTLRGAKKMIERAELTRMAAEGDPVGLVEHTIDPKGAA